MRQESHARFWSAGEGVAASACRNQYEVWFRLKNYLVACFVVNLPGRSIAASPFGEVHCSTPLRFPWLCAEPQEHKCGTDVKKTLHQA